MFCSVFCVVGLCDGVMVLCVLCGVLRLSCIVLCCVVRCILCSVLCSVLCDCLALCVVLCDGVVLYCVV